ncbi:MAG: GNAT family N-acetyltransferase [Acidobacteriia bacterium]|nr:GNAT family N-acetyltransferase [Terriglobia bacterium]MBV8903432.1 GNAT family N-acetyltransferase [Terriglobia bacterium]
MRILIRPGGCNDVEFLAWAMLCASRGHLPRGLWDLLIGSGEGACLEYLVRLAIVDPRSLYHFENFLIAEVEGLAAAALCRFETKGGGWIAAGAAMTQVEHDLGWTAEDKQASDRRIDPMFACLPPHSGADWVIENVATRAEFRGRGLARALLDSALSGRQAALLSTGGDYHADWQ